MIEEIRDESSLYAIIIRHDYSQEGIQFFTPPEFSQQLAYMSRPAGYTIMPHIHKKVHRAVFYTQEVLFIKKGKVKVIFYDSLQKSVGERVLVTGDVIMLAAGGHGFEMLEPTEMIEVKQGPFTGDDDKARFDGVLPEIRRNER
jgi:hypothetical protein